MPRHLSPRVLGRAEDAAADAHREELADKLLHLGAVLAREQVEGRHPIRHGTVDLRTTALPRRSRHGDSRRQSGTGPTAVCRQRATAVPYRRRRSAPHARSAPARSIPTGLPTAPRNPPARVALLTWDREESPRRLEAEEGLRCGLRSAACATVAECSGSPLPSTSSTIQAPALRSERRLVRGHRQCLCAAAEVGRGRVPGTLP